MWCGTMQYAHNDTVCVPYRWPMIPLTVRGIKTKGRLIAGRALGWHDYQSDGMLGG